MATQTEQPNIVKAPGYDEDVYLWSIRTAELIRSGRLEEMDRENVAEEIESLGKRYLTELRSRTRVLLAHIIKQDYQAEKRSRSWKNTIAEQRVRITDNMRDNPSLKRMLPELMQEHYEEAVHKAMRETGLTRTAFPKLCPYDPIQVYGEWMRE